MKHLCSEAEELPSLPPLTSSRVLDPPKSRCRTPPGRALSEFELETFITDLAEGEGA